MHFTDVADRVTGMDGKVYKSNHATIWRWRDAYQNDFAARMQWTLGSDISKANHAPVVIVKDSTAGPEPFIVEVEADPEVILDASKSYDPDGDELTFKWFHYKDATATQWWVDCEVVDMEIHDLGGEVPNQRVKITMPPSGKCAIDVYTREPQLKGQALHFILQVTDNGQPSMTTYKRVVLQATNKDLRAGLDKGINPIEDGTEFDWGRHLRALINLINA